MAIRFKVGAIPVECDTADEAGSLLLSIAKQSEASEVPREQTPPPSVKATTIVRESLPVTGELASAIRGWMASLDAAQQRAVKLVRDTPAGITTETMASALGCERDKLKYAIRSIRGAATKRRFDPDQVLGSQEVRENGLKSSRYTMTEAARTALTGID